MLKFFEVEARFPEDAGGIPVPAVSYVAQQVRVPAEEWAAYDWSGRAIKRHRMEIRGAFGFRECTEEDQAQLAEWLEVELCGVELNRDRLAEAVVARCRNDRLEPPAPGSPDRRAGGQGGQHLRGTVPRGHRGPAVGGDPVLAGRPDRRGRRHGRG
ncbi:MULTISPECIES: DUF4158 domain-containing protein [unclassified Streptomyces]|uniref:DUF4158 domain-containing protein n=1 Tax=unclassified Streptomyces TaxID=2593676 RepID=UPI00340978D4